MFKLTIDCQNCGISGGASCEDARTPTGSGWSPSVLLLSREFYTRINPNGGLETVCDGCRSVVELPAMAAQLKRACTVIDLRR